MSIIVKTHGDHVNHHSGICSAKLDDGGYLSIYSPEEGGEGRILIAQYSPGCWLSWEQQSGNPQVKAA